MGNRRVFSSSLGIEKDQLPRLTYRAVSWGPAVSASRFQAEGTMVSAQPSAPAAELGGTTAQCTALTTPQRRGRTARGVVRAIMPS